MEWSEIAVGILIAAGGAVASDIALRVLEGWRAWRSEGEDEDDADESGGTR